MQNKRLLSGSFFSIFWGAASCLWPPQVHSQQISGLLCALPEGHVYLLAILIVLLRVHRSYIVYLDFFALIIYLSIFEHTECLISFFIKLVFLK